jgi:hypothetical protein
VSRALVACAVTVVVVAAAPVVVLVGEPLRRYYLRRLSRPGVPMPSTAMLFMRNPVAIALTAPERWAIDQVRGLGSGGRGFGRGRGGWPPPAGVREPRRPRPSAPAGAIALAEPRQQHRIVRVLKALPPALSERVRRTGSFLGRMAHALRSRVSPISTSPRR